MSAETVVATPVWIEVSLCTPPELVEAVANFLVDEGSNGVVIEDIREDEAFADRRRMKWLWIRAYFDEEGIEALKDRLDQYLLELTSIFPLSEPPVLDLQTPALQDWSQCWKHFFKPMQLTERVMVYPSWEQVTPAPGVSGVAIDPGMAFGTGKHPTTRLCVRALQDVVLFPPDVQRPKDVFSMLDVGTGSGILSIIGAKFDIPRVLGIDMDPQAVESAQRNIELNQLSHRVEISDESVDELIETFDVVVANIVADTLVGMKKDLVRALVPGGVLILSGILRNQGAWLKNEYLTELVSFVTTLQDDEWCALVFQKI